MEQEEPWCCVGWDTIVSRHALLSLIGRSKGEGVLGVLLVNRQPVGVVVIIGCGWWIKRRGFVGCVVSDERMHG